MEPASGETAIEGRVNDAWASTSLTRLESSMIPAGSTMCKPPGVFLEPPPGIWGNAPRSQEVAEPVLKQARLANEEDQEKKGDTGEPNTGATGTPSLEKGVKRSTDPVVAGQALGAAWWRP